MCHPLKRLSIIIYSESAVSALKLSTIPTPLKPWEVSVRFQDKQQVRHFGYPYTLGGITGSCMDISEIKHASLARDFS